MWTKKHYVILVICYRNGDKIIFSSLFLANCSQFFLGSYRQLIQAFFQLFLATCSWLFLAICSQPFLASFSQLQLASFSYIVVASYFQLVAASFLQLIFLESIESKKVIGSKIFQISLFNVGFRPRKDIEIGHLISDQFKTHF